MKRSVALLGSSACLILVGAAYVLADHGSNSQEAAVTVGLSAKSSSDSTTKPVTDPGGPISVRQSGTSSPSSSPSGGGTGPQGSSRVVVPYVCGLYVASAEQVMNDAGLKYTIKQSHVSGLPGTVVAQSPTGTVPRGSIVTLTESTGGPSVFISNSPTSTTKPETNPGGPISVEKSDHSSPSSSSPVSGGKDPQG